MVATMDVKCCHCGGLLQDLRFLPITRRGHFFQDSFFSNIHQHFNAAVRNMLDSWGDPGMQLSNHLGDLQLHHTDQLQRYRQLRSQHLQEENQAVTVASDNSSHQMVLDVHEFSGGDVRVKLVGEGELVVEGQVEKTAGGGSSTSTHKFTKKFTLPESTDLDAITSVMSSDGILTITAPKQKASEPKTTVIPIQMEGKGSAPALQHQFSCETCYDTKPREYRVPIQQEQEPAGGQATAAPVSIPITRENNNPPSVPNAQNHTSHGQENEGSTQALDAQAVPKQASPQPAVTAKPAPQPSVTAKPAPVVESAPSAPPVPSPTANGTIPPVNDSQATNSRSFDQGTMAQRTQVGQATNLAYVAVPGGVPSQAKSFVPQDGEGGQDPQALYKTRNTGNFPVKIAGVVINTNSL